MANTTLEEAVNAAVEKETKQDETPQAETKVEETTKTAEAAPDERTQRALNLYAALDDPTTGPALLETLARKAGLLVQQGRATENQVVKSALDVLKENLGSEYEFLAPGLAKSLEQLIEHAVDAKVKPIQENNRIALEKSVERETDAEMEKFYAKHKDAKELDKEITALAKRMPFSGEGRLSDYLEDLYKIATYDKREARTVEKTVDRMNKNAKGARDASVEVPESRTKTGSKLPTLNEALAAGLKGERLF